ncbi:hypothetical protein N2152v2_000399 [Parachlorella kessleri]
MFPGGERPTKDPLVMLFESLAGHGAQTSQTERLPTPLGQQGSQSQFNFMGPAWSPTQQQPPATVPQQQPQQQAGGPGDLLHLLGRQSNSWAKEAGSLLKATSQPAQRALEVLLCGGGGGGAISSGGLGGGTATDALCTGTQFGGSTARQHHHQQHQQLAEQLGLRERPLCPQLPLLGQQLSPGLGSQQQSDLGRSEAALDALLSQLRQAARQQQEQQQQQDPQQPPLGPFGSQAGSGFGLGCGPRQLALQPLQPWGQPQSYQQQQQQRERDPAGGAGVQQGGAALAALGGQPPALPNGGHTSWGLEQLPPPPPLNLPRQQLPPSSFALVPQAHPQQQQQLDRLEVLRQQLVLQSVQPAAQQGQQVGGAAGAAHATFLSNRPGPLGSGLVAEGPGITLPPDRQSLLANDSSLHATGPSQRQQGLPQAARGAQQVQQPQLGSLWQLGPLRSGSPVGAGAHNGLGHRAISVGQMRTDSDEDMAGMDIGEDEVGGDKLAEARRKNREASVDHAERTAVPWVAQQRFRERQRAAARDAEEQYLAMESEAGRLLEENAELAARNLVLERILLVRDDMLQAFVAPPPDPVPSRPASGSPGHRLGSSTPQPEGPSGQAGSLSQQSQHAGRGNQHNGGPLDTLVSNAAGRLHGEHQQQQQNESTQLQSKPRAPLAGNADIFTANPTGQDNAIEAGVTVGGAIQAVGGVVAAVDSDSVKDMAASGPRDATAVTALQPGAAVLAGRQCANTGGSEKIPDISDLEAEDVHMLLPEPADPGLAERVKRMCYRDFEDIYKQWAIDMEFFWGDAQDDGFSSSKLVQVERSMGAFLHLWRAICKWQPTIAKRHMADYYMPAEEAYRTQEVAAWVQLSPGSLRLLAASWRRFRREFEGLQAERDTWMSVLRAGAPIALGAACAVAGLPQAAEGMDVALGVEPTMKPLPGHEQLPLQQEERSGNEKVQGGQEQPSEQHAQRQDQETQHAQQGYTQQHQQQLPEEPQAAVGRAGGYGYGPGMVQLNDGACKVAEAVAHLNMISDQEFILYTHLAAGWIASLGLQQVARANLASYPHIVDWVGITRAVLRRAVQESLRRGTQRKRFEIHTRDLPARPQLCVFVGLGL